MVDLTPFWVPWLTGAAGLLLGLLMAAIFVQLRAEQWKERIRHEAELEKTSLLSRLDSQDQQRALMDATISELRAESARLDSEVRSLLSRGAAAEEKNSRIPELLARLGDKDAQWRSLHDENMDLQRKLAEMETRLVEERKAWEDKLKSLGDVQARLSDTFKAISSEALRDSGQSFLHLASGVMERIQEGSKGDLEARRLAIDQLVKPLTEILSQLDQRVREVEQARTLAYATLTEQVQSLGRTQSRLHQETSNLVQALRTPSVRGRWGEMQLKRVAEIAGMAEHCDFFLQASTAAGGDPQLRPDMIVKLPSGRHVVVDAKAPLQAYLEAIESSDQAARAAKMKDHARQIRSHVTLLGGKSYWDRFKPAPEFVVLFLPGESFFSAALEQDRDLIEYGIERRVILATPTTLIALLRSVAYGWRQEQLAANAAAISDLGKSLHDRMHTLATHFADIRRGLDRSVEAYNRAVGTLEGRILPAARRLKEMGISSSVEIQALHPVERVARPLSTLGDGDSGSEDDADE
ncbi:MAG: DNA recombination protein RmuC [Syntrophobacteraceae bacterium]|jgi:DNA recombination protein RmuC|nr:DNA recombination protein RmuC [Syntrophobacteraceae bacterium]